MMPPPLLRINQVPPPLCFIVHVYWCLKTLICVSKHSFVFLKTHLYLVITVPSNEADATDAMRAATEQVEPVELLARVVVAQPTKYLQIFLDYWGENLPDLSEGRVPPVERLQFWRNLKCVAKLLEHVDLTGMCRKWCHVALDFAISQNQWPVVFNKKKPDGPGELYDMTIPFVLCTWVCYSAQMNGSPALKSKACQKVRICVLKIISVFGTSICVSKLTFVF